MNHGWVKLHRQIFENELWLSEPFTKAQAWVDLFANANHAGGVFYIRGNKIEVKRGQLGWSEVTMAKRWKWSRQKVRRFLEYLEKEAQIEQQKDRFITSITTILNYDEYQNDTADATAERQQKDSRRYINKNNKKEKNISKTKVSQKMGWNNKSDNDDDLPSIGDDGEIVKLKENTKRHYKEIYDIFYSILGTAPLTRADWVMNTTEQKSADNLYTVKGTEQVERALKLYEENKDIEFCPKIYSPSSLVRKWKQLHDFKNKNGL